MVSSMPALANKKHIKLYTTAFPGETPKCSACHVDNLPKIDDGKHDENDYGKSIMKESEDPTADTYKKIGKTPTN